MKRYWAFALVICVLACSLEKQKTQIDWQGHRGARGQLPENTVEAMRRALQDGVKTLEMDVVVTVDSIIVLSHEPFLNSAICLDTNGEDLSNEAHKYNIFQMTFEELKAYDCGSKVYESFAGQEKFKVYKPSLSEVILAAEETSVFLNREMPYYNIEIKSKPEWDGVYHPEVATYVDLLMKEISKSKIEERTNLQSFDKRSLQYAHENYPQMLLSLLVEDATKSFAEHIEELGFMPDIYSCHYKLLNPKMVKELQAQGIKVIPWTVNEIEEAQKLIKMGVDGIITDYPARIILALEP